MSSTKKAAQQPFQTNVQAASERIREVKENGGGLLVLTGAGMSVASGVPVFRNSDGSMSPDFLRFLDDFNKARADAKLPRCDDWFDFSRPEMFAAETAKEAWAYWRWRALRALVKPAQDYTLLQHLTDYFGPEHVFVKTSNCDMLHVKAGVHPDSVLEIHGSLGRVQCSKPCMNTLYTVEEDFLQRLRDEPDWVPMCPACKKHCLRPNVMIFGDGQLVEDALEQQESNFSKFENKFTLRGEKQKVLGHNWVVLEIGAGTVVPSIRCEGEDCGSSGQGLVRVNPSQAECEELEISGSHNDLSGKYFPLVARSNEALGALCCGLGLGGCGEEDGSSSEEKGKKKGHS